MQGPGHPLEDLKPLVDGNRDMTDQGYVDYVTLGCHKGDFLGLNIRNPQPDMHYLWINDDPRELARAIRMGRIPVDENSPEMSAVADLLGLEPTALDTACMFAGMRLMKTPIEVQRKHEAERQKLHDASFKSGKSERGYFDQTTELEAHYGRARGGSLRLMRDDHRTDVTEGPDPQGRRIDSWRPDLGLDYGS